MPTYPYSKNIFAWVWGLGFIQWLASYTIKPTRVSSSPIGCPIHPALCYISAKCFVNYDSFSPLCVVPAKFRERKKVGCNSAIRVVKRLYFFQRPGSRVSSIQLLLMFSPLSQHKKRSLIISIIILLNILLNWK